MPAGGSSSLRQTPAQPFTAISRKSTTRASDGTRGARRRQRRSKQAHHGLPWMTAVLAPSSGLRKDQTWPLWEQPRRFELGHILNCAVSDALRFLVVVVFGFVLVGFWVCVFFVFLLFWSGGFF